MKPTSDLHTRLRSAADQLSVGPPPLDRIARRGRRRVVRKFVSYGVALALFLAGVGVGLGSLRGLGNTNLQLPDGTSIPKPAITATTALPDVSDVITITDGSAWVGDIAGGLHRVDGTTGATRTIPGILGSEPSDLAAGEGSVWALLGNDVLRVDPGSNRVVDDIALGAPPLRIAVGGGSVWVTLNQGILVRIDPRQGRIAERIQLPWHGGSSPYAVTFAAGAAWVGGCDLDGAAVYRVAGGQVRRIALPDAGPVTYHGCVDQLTVGAGYLWALSNPVHDQGSLLRAVDLTSRAPAGPVTSLHAQAFGIAFADRVLWVLVRPKGGDTNTRVLSIVDPSTRTFVGRPIPVGTFADRIASGEGALWVPSVRSTGTPVLLRIRP